MRLYAIDIDKEFKIDNVNIINNNRFLLDLENK